MYASISKYCNILIIYRKKVIFAIIVSIFSYNSIHNNKLITGLGKEKMSLPFNYVTHITLQLQWRSRLYVSTTGVGTAHCAHCPLTVKSSLVSVLLDGRVTTVIQVRWLFSYYMPLLMGGIGCSFLSLSVRLFAFGGTFVWATSLEP